MAPQPPSEVISQAESEKFEKAKCAREAFSWFLDAGGMVERREAVEGIAEELGWDHTKASSAVTGLTDDTLDPVQLVRTSDGTFVGIVQYEKFQDTGAYGYVEYDDTFGDRKNIVCAKCVEENLFTSQVFRAVAGVGRHDKDCNWQSLKNHCTQHYTEEHTEGPQEVNVAASLVSGTTISSNTAYHQGNDGNLAKQNVGLQAPEFATTGDVPAGITAGELVFITGDNSLYVEDGT